MSESAGEKSFEPTEKRKRDAAKNGDVLRSKELGTAVSVMVGAIWLKFAGPMLMVSLEDMARSGFNFRRSAIADFDPTRIYSESVMGVVMPVVTLGLIMIFFTVGSQILFGDGRFVGSNLAPKFSRIDPIKGMGKIFGTNGLIELGKSLLKITLLGAITWWWGRDKFQEVMALGSGEIVGQLEAAWELMTGLLLVLASGLVAIAMIDFPIQYMRRRGRLMMTLQEVRDENKESEGSPENKAALRNKQRAIAMGGVTAAMQDAQFVITNPTHFSVALAYDPERADAPIVLAKGRGDKALAMREIAAEMGLPTLEYPPLARSLYFTTRENQMIREELYVAVAAVLSFVLSLKRGEKRKTPVIDVPTEMQFDSEGRQLRA